MGGKATREKRTKPCSNCKRLKVKCIYTTNLPCERCLKSGQAMSCQFMPKLPSLQLPHLNTPPQHHIVHQQPPGPQFPQEKPITTLYNRSGDVLTLPPISSLSHPLRDTQTPIQPKDSSVPKPIIPAQKPPSPPGVAGQLYELLWKDSMENRMNSFDNKLTDLVELLKTNQQMFIESQRHHQHIHNPQANPQPQINQHARYSQFHITSSQQPQITSFKSQKPDNFYNQHNKHYPPKREIEYTSERPRKQQRLPEDFRDGFLSKSEASELFSFFKVYIAQQLFGFDISQFLLDVIWETCPILVCAISVIALIHHPVHSVKSAQLQQYLNGLCSSLLFKGNPKDETEGFNTIVALVLCSFWLTDSQMFTGLALQLAKAYGLNNPHTKNKEKLKLWYLLYVLDGQQSLTFNRQPLLSSDDYSLKNSKAILLKDQKSLQQDSDSSTSKEDEENLPSLTSSSDMRLVSQVEYNQALQEAFDGNAWDLLAPSSFGIPSKSNLELDKWMVSWTVLLAPGHTGAVWSSKSTMIYYNFAKMHINSLSVRHLRINPTAKSLLPLWKQHNEIGVKEPPRFENHDDDSDSEDSDGESSEFISNKEFMLEDSAIVSANIALNAALTVLNLVINDRDILDNLKYVPVHIHIMLYYAALLILNPPAESLNKSEKPDDIAYYHKVLNNIKTIKAFQKKIHNNLPIDTKFGKKLIKLLASVVDEKIDSVKSFLQSLGDTEEKESLQKLLTQLLDNADGVIEIVEDTSSRGSTSPGPEKISAWPGSNHGHP